MKDPDPSPDGGTGYTSRHRVRYADTDQMGVVHHANYLAYLEEARTDFMEALGWPYAEIERAGWGLVVRSVSLRYRAPAHYGDTLQVTTRVAEMRRASVLFEYEVRRAGTLLAEATTELACVRLDRDRRPAALPPELVRRLEEARPGGSGPAADPSPGGPRN